jgi:rRNA processing protein Gar1
MRSGKRLGTVIHVSKSTGNLILRAEEDAGIGDSVFDKHGKRVGSIYDFFGPVTTPFVSVKTRLEDPSKLEGEPVFLGDRKR